MSVTLKLVFVAFFWTLLLGEESNNQPMRWCGGRLNPWEDAKAMATATNFFLTCKKEILSLRMSRPRIQHLNILCGYLRLRYAFVQANQNATTPFKKQVMSCLRKATTAFLTLNPDFEATYNINMTEFLEVAHRCAASIPDIKDVRYLLRALDYAKDFIPQ
ncbi:uncharacterized protein LOC144145188 [Haemaphysalis longicornis]